MFDRENMFASLEKKIINSLTSDKVVAGKMCSFISEFAYQTRPVEDQNRTILSNYFEELFTSMMGFAYHGYELGDEDGKKMILSSFNGIFSLLQYSARDVHRSKVDMLRTLYDRIEEINKKNSFSEIDL